MEKEKISHLIDILGQIKDLKRTGWIERGVSTPESDADHMFSTAFLVLALTSDNAVNRCRCLELALTHDLAEIIAGDPIPGEKSPEDKYLSELAAITDIGSRLKMPQLIDWFKEFSENQTPEAKLVNSLDKLDTVLTAAYYERNQRPKTEIWKEFSSYAVNKLNEMDNTFAAEAVDIIKKIEV